MRAFYFNLFLLVSLFLVEAKFNAASKSERERVYIVYMGKKCLLDGVPRSDHAQLLGKLKKRKKADCVLHTYNKSFLGFAARLSDEEAESIAQTQGVVSVFPDKVAKLHTTRSWDFLKSQNPLIIINSSTTPITPPISICPVFGADTIIGILDTGIWPEHLSFNDYNMRPIPRRWKGKCEKGKHLTPSFKCNRKVIGARFYDDPDKPGYITSARDEHGHGTHVASTAAGKPVSGASYKGLAEGTARGGSPDSRIAAYRVCGPDGNCVTSLILKALDDAIADGVDVLSISIGGDFPDLLTDVIAIGAFHAAENGITVVCGAGNNGPDPGTLQNFYPWMLTIAATSIDRDFQATVVLGDRKKKIKAGGFNFSGLNKSPVYHIVEGRSASSNQTNVTDARYCIPGSLNGAKVKGKIVLCEYWYPTNISDLIDTLMSQGAIGIVLSDDYFRQKKYDYGTTPFAPVSEEDGAQIQSYINSTRYPLATILPTETILGYKPAPVVPFYSSRGPVPSIENLLKPDVAAPGVNILAAWPPLPFHDTSVETIEPPLFYLQSGTSQACPHVSGLAALVKSCHPKWSPSTIHSAITTTAVQKNNLNAPITVQYGSDATPYDIGAGEISLFGPLHPGLIYETKATDYFQFLCNMGYNASVIKFISSTVSSNFSCPCKSSPDLVSDMNYPSIAISRLEANGRRAVKRTVTNVGDESSSYVATVEAPPSLQVQVVPEKMQFTKDVKKRSFHVIFKLTKTSNESLFGSITWSNERYKVRSPFAINQAQGVTLRK